jgi:hypothetical protein
MLGKRELTPDDTLGSGGEDLETPRTTRKVGNSSMCGRDVGPKDRAKTPAEVIRQCIVTSAWLAGSLFLTRDIAHIVSLRALEPGSVVTEILCLQDDLLPI